MNKIYFYIFIVIIFLTGFFIYQPVNNLYLESIKNPYTPEEIPSSEDEIVENCKNLELSETAYCLRDNVKTFYNYIIRSNRIIVDFDELKKEGGDCSEYSKLYKRLGEKTKYDIDTILYNGIDRGDVPSHMFAVIWDDNQYCKLDQLRVVCYDK